MPRPLAAADLLTLSFVSGVQAAPDGGAAAWVVTDIVPGTEGAPPRYRSRVHLATDLKRRGGRAFTLGDYSDTAPRFSPDGTRLAFLRVSAPKTPPQLHVMPLTGGEPLRLTDHAAGVGTFAWAPSGRELVYATNADYKDEPGEKGLPRRITRRYWRGDGVGVLPTEPAQLHAVGARGGKPRRLTDLPEAPALVAFAPDGRSLWVTVPAGERPEGDHLTALLHVDLESGAFEERLAGLAGISTLAPSPDGRWLAYTANQVPSDLASEAGVWLLPTDGSGAPRLVSGASLTPPSAGGDARYGAYAATPAWSGDGATLLINVNHRGASGLSRLDVASGELTPLQGGRRVVTAFSAPAEDGPLVALFVAERPDAPGEVHALWSDGRETRLSGVNDAWRRRHELVDSEGPFPAGAGGAEYWLLRPARPRPDGAAVLQVHGGPHTNYGYGFSFEFQLLAARGYAVVFGNPRGSSSYGTAFATGFLGAYGTVDADDVMAFAEDGRARLGRPDAPVHLTGGSYGGFMTNWLVGHTDRFRSAVTQRSICNWTSMYGTSDIGPWFVERQLGGVAWGDVATLWRQSPLRLADKVVTPLLIVHSEEDHRCPIEQAEQLFSVLKRLGKAETEFFRVPGEGHDLSRSGRPDRRVARLLAIVDWFERHP